MEEQLIEEALSKKIWAVVGATPRMEKYGYKIYKTLKDHGYTVYPVNPNYKDVGGDPCYADLKSLPQIPQAVDMVVSPKFADETIKQAASLGCGIIWFQPGAESDEVIAASDSLGLKVVHHDCVMRRLSGK